MIYFRKEGSCFKSGLNITISWLWFSFCWLSIDLDNYQATSYYFRFRLLPYYPKVFFLKRSWNLIDNYLLNRSLVLIIRETHEDLLEYKNKKYIMLDWYQSVK